MEAIPSRGFGMHSLEENDYRELARVLGERVASHAPDWTDANNADPGVAILELLAVIAESLVSRSVTLSERGRLSAARLAESALVLASGNGQAESRFLERNWFYAGRLLTAQDLRLEQDYIRQRLRRHNRELHGVGIVRGLQVSVRPQVGGTGDQVVLQPGFAIAPDGEEIDVGSEASADLPKTGTQLWVMLSQAERFTHSVPTDGEQVQFTRIEETFALSVEPTAGENGVALAQLIRRRSGWKVDQAFSAPRIKSHEE
jgi:hypothetical protein